MSDSDEITVMAILQKHIDKACDEISAAQIDVGYWPPGYAGRMAKILTQALFLMADSSHTTSEESE